jgi:hypothetical protein
MAYDLFYKTTTPVNLARPVAPPSRRSFASNILNLCIAGVAIALPELQRHREISKYKKEFATDAPIKINLPHQRPIYAKRRLKTTMAVPITPMKDLVFSR